MKQTITQRKRSANALNQPRGSLEDTHQMKDRMKEAISNCNKFIFLVANKIKRNLPHHLIIRISTKREKKGIKTTKIVCEYSHFLPWKTTTDKKRAQHPIGKIQRSTLGNVIECEFRTREAAEWQRDQILIIVYTTLKVWSYSYRINVSLVQSPWRQ